MDLVTIKCMAESVLSTYFFCRNQNIIVNFYRLKLISSKYCMREVSFILEKRKYEATNFY